MSQKNIGELKAKLEESKNDIVKQLESFAKEDENIKHNWTAQFPNREKGNPEEEADDATEYENLVSLEHSLELKLKDVNLALEKINNANDYGTCEKCHKDIEENRLQACPEARFCIKCNDK